jgi:hypothetical protein
MNNTALGKAITRFVIDKNDWIVGYKIDNHSFGFVQKYTIYYFVESSDRKEEEVERLTKQLFTALGFGVSEVLSDVKFIKTGGR